MGADDPNGEEAGKVFLEANKAKDGLITLPSGLQYRVIEEGAGMEHPTVGTPCECHYAGRLLDGTELVQARHAEHVRTQSGHQGLDRGDDADGDRRRPRNRRPRGAVTIHLFHLFREHVTNNIF